MQVIQGLSDIGPEDHHAVVTIGNFDGVHRGHQALLKRLKYLSLEKDLESIIITFEPSPQEFLRKDKTFIRLSSLRDKVLEFQNYQIDKFLLIPFTSPMAKLTATQFVKEILYKKLKINYLLIGDDFHFGCHREGDGVFLKRIASRYDFEVEEVERMQQEDREISSSWIRECLLADDLEKAQELLGRAYRICGRVMHGDERGRTLGIPTANVHMKLKSLALQGVYAVAVRGISARPLLGVANVGKRPTIDGKSLSVEVHLFDFTQDIYGCRIQLEFLKKIRDEQKFSSLDALKTQIEKDIKAVKKFFQNSKEQQQNE